MRSTPSLPLLRGLLWPGVVVRASTLSMGQIELFDHLLRVIMSEMESYSCVQIIYIL